MLAIAHRSKSHRRMSTFQSLAVLIIVAAGSTAYGQYRLIDLGDIPDGYEYSFAHDLNNHGQITGFLRSNDGGSQPFFWDPTNGYQVIPYLQTGDTFGAGNGINDQGQVVGFTSELSDQGINSHAFIWDRVNGIQELLAPAGTIVAMAEQINNQGAIIGTARIPSDTSVSGMRAVIWENGSSGSFLGGLTVDDPAIPVAMNQLGQVIGTDNNGAFIWDATNGFRSIDPLNQTLGVATQPTGINDAGQVVGDEVFLGMARMSFLWDESNGISRPVGTSDDFVQSSAFDINAAGRVVGTISVNNDTSSFLWDSTNGLRNLNDLVDDSAAGWKLGAPRAINDKGWIMGRGAAPDGTNRTYLLIPEPATVMLLLALVVPALRRR